MSADTELVRSTRAIEADESFRLEKDPGDGPFGLTDLQQGYWIGETENLGLAGPAFFYSLHTCEALDVPRFDAAVNALIARHEMLQVRFTGDARQEPVRDLPAFRSEFIDAAGKSDRDVQRLLDDIGERIVHQRFQLKDWPLFRFWIVKTSNQVFVWSMFKLIIIDGRSGEVFARELRDLLQGRALGLPELRFRDYVNSLNVYRKTGKYRKSQEFWRALAPDLPAPPDLPKRGDWEKGGFVPMTHRSFTLPAVDWKKVNEECRRRGVTPTAFMCSLFCSVLAYWSRSPQFTLAVMYANRPNIAPGIFDVIGNFSNTILVTHEWPERETFTGKTRKLQATLLKRLSHGLVSGVEVMREVNRNRDGGGISLMPVVFASSLGLGAENEQEPMGLEKLGWKPVKTGINTSQVVFDHRIAENLGGLMVNWDTRDCLFPDGLIDDMFRAYEGLLRAFAARPALWDERSFELLPAGQAHVRHQVNSTEKTFPTGQLLYHGFLENAARHPDKVFILNRGKVVRYGEALDLALNVAACLAARGVGPGDVVPIYIEKGWEQVICCLGVLFAGAAYLPVSPGTPQARIASILAKATPKVVLADGDVELDCCTQQHIPVVDFQDLDLLPERRSFSPRGAAGDLAYVIFTSGTTGDPNGVAITHQAALNTIHDMNERFGITGEDRILSVSELNFDLSVYDIFGMAAAGGSLVIPDREMTKNPLHFSELVDKHRVTLWNTVPAYLEMLVSLIEFKRDTRLSTLRIAFLSGDWIPTSLPGRLAKINPDIQLNSLGGATEASIWSNYFPVKAVPAEWKSIPYGYPLANQRFHVLDRDFNHRPDHVAGELYIAGDGLAVGYFRDEVRTREKFFEHPRTGERLYRTGDWGRYWGDGTLEFLGRQDTQVKIRGFRIELGEIDAALRKLPQVEESLSLTFGEGSGKSLAAFVRRKAGTSTAAVPYPDLLEHLLPGYMIPSVILEIDEFPLTPNGKVNRSALLQRIQLSEAPEARVETRLTPLESGIMKIWKDILDPPRLDRTTNFFHAGGNSILAITMINEIEAAHQVRMPLSVLYQRQTVAQIAEYLETYRPAKQDVLVPIHQEGKGRKLFLVHPIGGGILCYAPAAEVFKSDFDIIAVQSLSQAHPGSTPARIEEMAEAYADRVASENGCQEVSLLGWSMGGLLSIAMKGILERKGLRVRVVALDPWIAKADPQSCDYSPALAVAEFFKDLNWGKAPSGHFQFRSQDTATMLLEYKDHLEQAAAGPATFHADTLAQLFEEYDRNLRAILGYAVPSLDRDVALFRAGRTDRAGFRFLRPITDALEPLAQAGAVLVDENHFSIVGEGFLRSRKAQLLGMLAHTGNEAEEIHIGSHRDMPLHRQPVPASHHHGRHERLHLASKKDTGKPAAINSPKHQEN